MLNLATRVSIGHQVLYIHTQSVVSSNPASSDRYGVGGLTARGGETDGDWFAIDAVKSGQLHPDALLFARDIGHVHHVARGESRRRVYAARLPSENREGELGLGL